ncbi:MAG: Abi family protein [Clostridia bacterium]|nr:Abi family protein [Clostridia bacterium]
MIKKRYNKTPLTFEDQLVLLKTRGLEISNEAKALAYLNEISYFRLSAYFLPYQSEKDKFNPGTTFSQIIHTYTFDRELRLLVFDCIERIEIAIRTQMIYSMAHYYNDSHWQDNPNIFVTPYCNKSGILVDPYSELQTIISKAKTARTPEAFIKHYTDSYHSPSNPPSWMCLELLTIGELSRLYKGLKKNQDKKLIADFFDVHHTVFISWLHSLTYVRNICAHHSRLWNRDLSVEPNRLLKPKGEWISKPFENNSRVFYFMCVLKYLLLRANPGNGIKERLIGLFKKYPNIPVQFIGIPSDGKGKVLEWQNEPIWQ